jgi:hypothetical protein
MARKSGRRPQSSQFHRLMSGASAGCTAFLLGCLVLGVVLVALTFR